MAGNWPRLNLGLCFTFYFICVIGNDAECDNFAVVLKYVKWKVKDLSYIKHIRGYKPNIYICMSDFLKL